MWTSYRNRHRARQLVSLFDNPTSGVEFGTRSGMLAETLLHHFRSLHLIAVDNWLPVPWVAGGDVTDQDKQHHRDEAIRRLDRFRHRVSLWQMDALAAAMILRGYEADFVHCDVLYDSYWLKRHLPIMTRVVRKGGLLTGGGWQRRHVRQTLVKLFSGRKSAKVVGDGTLWWVEC